MPFDVLSAIEITVSAMLVTTVLAFTLSRTLDGRLRAAAILGVWFALVVALGATRLLYPETGLGIPALAVVVTVPIAALCIAFFAVPATQAAMLATPMPLLIAVNTLRLLGFAFVALYAAHRLPAPFAPAAGWGDILVGVTAPPVAWLAARYGARANGVVLFWNVIGFLDLVTAVTLGVTSSPGPLRLFTEAPGASLMTTLPWIIIPCFIVPSLAAVHLAIFYRLSRESRAVPQVAHAGIA